MRGLEEIIHMNERAKNLEVKVSELEVQKRKLEEEISDLKWQKDMLKHGRL